MSGITIVVKGEDGRGRTQIAEILKQALLDKGFTDVAVVPTEKADLNHVNIPFREQSVLIVEG